MATPRKQGKIVKQGDIPDWAGCFRKTGGSTTYLRIAVASARFHGLDTSFVYGVSYNGNMCKVLPETFVVQMSLKDIVRDSGETTKFERSVLGCKQPSEE